MLSCYLYTTAFIYTGLKKTQKRLARFQEPDPRERWKSSLQKRQQLYMWVAVHNMADHILIKREESVIQKKNR